MWLRSTAFYCCSWSVISPYKYAKLELFQRTEVLPENKIRGGTSNGAQENQRRVMDEYRGFTRQFHS